MIILAAGEGKRLRPLTNEIPKCMVKYNGIPIIDYAIRSAKSCGINKIAVVGGFKINILKKHLEGENVIVFENKIYRHTNMVSTLFCAREFMDDDLIISYSDIVYSEEILKSLIDGKKNISVVVDKKWRLLWDQRMSNPLDDAETLVIKDNKIIEIGEKPLNFDHIHGQYIGLIKIKKEVINDVINFYDEIDKDQKFDSYNFDNMYMTSFLQLIIDKLMDVNPIIVGGGWIEIDTNNDLKLKMI